MPARPGNLQAQAPAQRRSLPRPAHVSRRHRASSSLAARPAATDLRPQQSSRATQDRQGSTPSTQALGTRPLLGLQRGEDPEDPAVAGSLCGAVQGWAWGGVYSPGKGRAGEAGPLPLHSLVPAAVSQRKAPPPPPALPRPVSCGAHRKEEVYFRSEGRLWVVGYGAHLKLDTFVCWESLVPRGKVTQSRGTFPALPPAASAQLYALSTLLSDKIRGHFWVSKDTPLNPHPTPPPP